MELFLIIYQSVKNFVPQMKTFATQNKRIYKIIMMILIIKNNIFCPFASSSSGVFLPANQYKLYRIQQQYNKDTNRVKQMQPKYLMSNKTSIIKFQLPYQLISSETIAMNWTRSKYGSKYRLKFGHTGHFDL